MMNHIKKLEKESKAQLAHLQKQRTKANKKRKAAWTRKISQYFGLA